MIMVRILGAEVRRAWLSGGQWMTGTLMVVYVGVWALPGTAVPPFRPNALVQAAGFGHLAPLVYGNVLEVGIPVAASFVLLVVEGDMQSGNRVLPAAWPVPSGAAATARWLAVLGLGAGWTILATVIPALCGRAIPSVRDIALVFPVEVAVTGVVLLAAEVSLEPLVATACLLLLILLGAGIPHFPFADPALRQQELFDARSHFLGPTLWANRLVLLGGGFLAGLGGVVAFIIQRQRGAFAQ